MIAVSSSAITSVGFDPASATLFVRFRSGETYGYLDVDEATFERLLAAASKGRFFQEEIDPVFRYVRLEA